MPPRSREGDSRCKAHQCRPLDKSKNDASNVSGSGWILRRVCDTLEVERFLVKEELNARWLLGQSLRLPRPSVDSVSIPWAITFPKLISFSSGDKLYPAGHPAQTRSQALPKQTRLSICIGNLVSGNGSLSNKRSCHVDHAAGSSTDRGQQINQHTWKT